MGEAFALLAGFMFQGVAAVCVLYLGLGVVALGLEEGVPLVDGPPVAPAVPRWPATLAGASTSAPSAHVADAVREDTADAYCWRPVCRCGWAHRWRYASEPAALGMADDHVWQAVEA